MINPYQPPASRTSPTSRVASFSVSLVILAILFLLTEVFALINAIEEAMPSEVFTLFFTAIAGITQLPGLFIARSRWKTRTTATIPMEVGAYVIALTGCGVYAVYAFDGKADSLNTSGHLHVIAFPMAHGMLTVLVYIMCGVVSRIIDVFTTPRN